VTAKLQESAASDIKGGPMESNNASQPLPATRCVIILNAALAAGKAANAAAVLALTAGQRHPALVGASLADAAGCRFPGLISVGISVLSASAASLCRFAAQAAPNLVDCVVFPRDGQSTTDYRQLLDAVAVGHFENMEMSGIALIGDKKLLRSMTAGLSLWG
jgi:hypothetical protein